MVKRKNKINKKNRIQSLIVTHKKSEKEYKIRCEYKRNIFEKSLGFMFRFRQDIIMFFPFKKNTHIDIHNFFVFQTLMCFWLDEKNIVVEKKELKPFTIYNTKNKTKTLIEIPKKLYDKKKMEIKLKNNIKLI